MKKTTLLLCLFSIFLFSCDNQNISELTDQDKESIKSEISPLMDKIISSLNNKEWDKANEDYLNSPDFVAISTGHVFDYKTYIDACTAANESLKSQLLTETSRQYTFINQSTVILTWKGSVLMETMDDQKFISDPYALSLLFVKNDTAWTINYSHESGSIVPMIEDSTSAEL